ncbi:alcohol dehydrogenase catalytic domain-containing protein, partial [Acinetobacter baumannii]
MQAVVVSEANAQWQLEDRARPQPGPNEVLIRIHACGICGTDVWMSTGT